MNKSPLACILFIVVIDLLGYGMIIPLLPLYAQRFHATEWQIGFLLASFAAMQFLASPFLGWFSDRHGRRPVLLASLVGSAAGYMLMASAGSLSMLFLARILAGVAGASVGTVTAYIADITPAEKRSSRNALIGASYSIGGILGPALAGLLSPWSIVAPFWLAAILSGSNAIWTWSVLREPERHALHQQAPGNLRQAFREAGGWRLGIVTMTKFASSTGFAIWLTIAPQVLFRRFGLDESQISFVFVAAAILSVAIQAGLFSRLAKHFGDVDLQIAGLAIMAVCPFIMPSTGPFPLFVTFAMVFVIGMSLSLPIPSALASKLASAAMQGRVLGIVDSVNCLGGVCGPVFAGFLLTADHARPIGQYGNSPLLACGVILAIGCAVAVTLRQPKPKSVASPHVAPDKKS